MGYVGSAYATDTGVVHTIGIPMIRAGFTTFLIYVSSYGGGWDATHPFTWGNTDFASVTITYEVA